MTKSGTKNFSDLLIAKIFGILSTLNVDNTATSNKDYESENSDSKIHFL